MYRYILVIMIYYIFFMFTGIVYSNETIECCVVLQNHIFKNNGKDDIKVVEFRIPDNFGYNEARIYCSLDSETLSSLPLSDRINIRKNIKIFSLDRKTLVFESDFPLLGGISFPIIQSGLIVEIWSKELPEGTWTSDVGINYYKDSIFTDSINREKLLSFQERFFSSYDHEMRKIYLYGSWRDLPSTSSLSFQIGFDGGTYLESLLSENAEIVFMDGDKLKKVQTSEYFQNLFKTQFVYLTRLKYLSDPIIKTYDNYGIIERRIEINGMDPLGGICDRHGEYICQLKIQIVEGRLKTTRIEFRRI